jgi:DNA-binding PadR family transcriptional regulator
MFTSRDYGRCGDRRHAHGPFGFSGRLHRHLGRGMRPGRIFDHGDLRFIVLQLISERPRHGYEVIKDIEEQLGGVYSPSPGVVYPTLTLLEELGYVTATQEGTKKLYAITGEGTAFLAANRVTVDAVFARLAEARRAYGGGPAPEILRAAQNLRVALSLRLRKGPLSEEQVRAVSAALDRAAGEIERS